jgi:DegV family protein with EDD domain
MAGASVRIVTDSSSDIPREVVDDLQITVVPLSISFGAQSYRDGLDLSADDFYARLASTKELPKTSQPPPALFQHAYEHLVTQGEVVSIHLSAKFSGTVEAARQVAAQLAPDKISVVDTHSASMGVGFCAIAAARAAKAGASREECAAIAEQVAGRLHIAVAFESLEYVRRGGRIGRAAAFVGGLLKVQPILTIRDGEAFPVTRVRNRAKALDEISLWRNLTNITDIGVFHTTTPDEASALAARARSEVPTATVYEGRFGPVLGVHGGPGMIGVGVVADPKAP